jgi:outer membrane protein TolC
MTFWRVAALGGVALFTGMGCQSAHPTIHVERTAAIAAGGFSPIEFTTQGGPLDVAEAPGRTLTLRDAAELALTRSPAVQAALARVRAAEADADQARLLPNPVLSVAFRFPEGGGKPNIDAGLSADLIALLRRPGSIRAADDRLRAAGAEAVTTALDVLLEVQQHYIAAQTLDERVRLLNERRATIDRLTELARARLNAGEGTALDVTTLEAQRLEFETELADTLLERRDERLVLARLLGEPSGAAQWELTPWDAAPRDELAESRWIATALEHRPEVQARRWELAARAADRLIAGFAPFDGTAIGADAERDGDWSVGPSASVPLPLFDVGSAKRAAAAAAVIEARHRLTEARRTAVEETRRAYTALTASRENLVRVRDRLIPLQERRRQQAEDQYKQGVADITAVFLAEQDLLATRSKLIDLQRRVADALLRLQRAVGGAGAAPVAEGATPGTSTTRPVIPSTTSTSRATTQGVNQ